MDPALVPHYFGSKQELFVAVVELPFDPAVAIPAVLRGDADHAGERFAAFLLGMLDRPEARDRIIGLVRAAASEPNAARMVRDLISRQAMAAIASELKVDDADIRANLVGSQVVGLLMARYIVKLEPLASLPAERVAAAIAPNLQRYLTGPLAP